ncbi:hypothetical protein [Maritalea porphyrae]|uniref:hypothetical protein n=1 Tax=Maritalea porphyrae TaxID=880732 RepID=UPI0022AFDB9A|nr:hypothetical protein [Maritalea porphyrae]MCZ4273526.1 hypothetical protein [Maritalea porphyrae]
MKKFFAIILCATALAVSSTALVTPANAKNLIKLMEKDLGGRRPKGCPNKWCACYMDKILAKAGFDTRGSYRARDFAKYGKKANPVQVGSIMVLPNHVGVVMGKCDDGRVKIISGNYSKKVAVGCYSAKKAIAWRLPVKGN